MQAAESKDNLSPDQELLNNTQDKFDQESLSSASPTEILEAIPSISKKAIKIHGGQERELSIDLCRSTSRDNLPSTCAN